MFPIENKRRPHQRSDNQTEGTQPSLVPEVVKVIQDHVKKPVLKELAPKLGDKPPYTLVTRDELRASYRRIPQAPDRNLEISRTLSTHVVGQTEAIETVSRHILMAESGLNDPSRPIASILELGPTGVGKTEMAKATAKYLFGQPWEQRFLLVNCAELSEKHTALRLTGSPPSYVGNQEQSMISHDWLQKGKTGNTSAQKSVIVFDELEKAHVSIHDALLSILDEGKLVARNADKGQQPLDFTQSWIFATSNVGATEMRRLQIGFQVGGQPLTDHRVIEGAARDAMSKAFRPEFINRFSDIIVFKELGEAQLTQIFDKFIDEKNGQLSARMDHPPIFAVTPELREFMVAETNKKNGGRGLRNLVDKRIFGYAAQRLEVHKLGDNMIVADYDTNEEDVVFYTTADPK